MTSENDANVNENFTVHSVYQITHDENTRTYNFFLQWGDIRRFDNVSNVLLS